jgi:hypothetical protein
MEQGDKVGLVSEAGEERPSGATADSADPRH